MRKLKLIEILRAPKAELIHVFEGALWYEVRGPMGHLTSDGFSFKFPVPFKDTEGAHFYPVMKPTELMKWIQKYMKTLKESD